MPDLLEGLNDAQRAAVDHRDGPLLIVAGAGTGKTTVLTRRYVHLLETGSLKPEAFDRSASDASSFKLQASRLTTDNILALTFTEKAAGEMEDRVLELLPNGAYDFWISTFHGFCQRVLEMFALEIGLPDRFRIVTQTESWLLLREHLNELPLEQYRPLGNPVKFLGALVSHISRAKDEGVSPSQYLEFAESCALDGDAEFVTGERARLMELAKLYAMYQKLLRDDGALDFGDLILETLRLLRERPHVLKQLREQFRYVMVDEFQDTNWAQYELVKLIAGPAKNLTVVGDDDQAIYKFRGASLANILQFRDDFPEAKTVTLTDNYRSRQEILDTAYGFITHNNPNRLEVRLKDTGLTKQLKASRGDGGTVEVLWARSLEDEAEAVAQKLKRLKREHPQLTWNDFAILSRSNDGTEPFIAALERHAIPYRFFAQRGLYAKPDILDLTSLLTLAVGNHDDANVYRVMTSSWDPFAPRDLSLFLQYVQRRGVGLLEAIRRAANPTSELGEVSDEGKDKCREILSIVDKLSVDARRERPLKVLQLALDRTGALSAIMRRPEAERIEAIGYLNAFASRVRRYEASTISPSLRGFLDELDVEIESGEEGALAADPSVGPEVVSVMTIHASKGLEFDHVFVVSLVDQRFPTRARSESIPLPDGLVQERLPEGNSHLEEERRLFYVAMTRAKSGLTLSGADSYGGTRAKKPSVFLDEAGFSPGEERAGSEVSSLTPASEAFEMPEDLAYFPLKRRFSFTQLAAFRTCPLQYKFAHVYKIPILGSWHKSYGQSIHLALKDILERDRERKQAKQGNLFEQTARSLEPDVGEEPAGFRVSLDEMLQIFEARWIDEWYDSREHHDTHKQEGRDAMKRLYELWSASPPDVAFLETPFDWRLGEHSLKGAVDRIDRLPTGGYAIFDYKTGAPKTEDDIETKDKQQLWIYQIAMEERGLDIRRLSYLYLRNGTEVPVEILQGEKRADFIADIEDAMTSILQSSFPPKPSPFTCKNCDFRHICQFKKV